MTGTPPAAEATIDTQSGVRVRVAEHAVATQGTLATIGLGSCVAVILYDARARVGGLAHVMLPDETMARDRSKPAKFPGSAVYVLVRDMETMGAVRGRIRARIVGGASMFSSLLPSGGTDIGDRNIHGVRIALAAVGIPIDEEDVGADYGRSVYFRVSDGRVEVKSMKRGLRVI